MRAAKSRQHPGDFLLIYGGKGKPAGENLITQRMHDKSLRARVLGGLHLYLFPFISLSITLESGINVALQLLIF